MDDLITRQAAIETVRKAKSKGEAHRMIIQLPPAQPELLPCDVCRYYPQSSMDGKPCTICPAERKNDE